MHLDARAISRRWKFERAVLQTPLNLMQRDGTFRY